jgi:RHS repeat-associated protein
MGEKFAPDLFTGTGNFAVPLNLPAGRNGFQPSLSLTYSTGHGNGPFGLGFTLGVPSVTRKTHPIPRGDASDVFILSGSEDLVPVEANDNRQYYRPRTEGSFARIAHVTGVADYWEVTTKDGLVSLYGDAGGAGAASVRDPKAPDSPGSIFSWKLSQTSDPFANRITYEYERDRVRGDARNGDQNYIKRVRYGDYQAAGQTRFLVSVEFYYDDENLPHAVSPPTRARPDPFSEFRAGFEVRTRRRCTLIVVRSHPAGAVDVPIRAYRLIYLDERTDLTASEGALPANGVSLLSRVDVLGYDAAGQPVSGLPPLDFAYTRFEPARRLFVPVQRGPAGVPSLADPTVTLVDVHGGGLPDIVTIDGDVRFCRNLGGGRFAPERSMRDSPGVSLADPGVQLLDVNGDSRADLVANSAQTSTVFTLEFGPRWKRRPSQMRRAPAFGGDDPDVRFLDLDGDGVTDAVRTAERFECFFQDEREGWKDIRIVTRRPAAEFPDVSFADEHVKLATLAGGELQDIALVHAGSLSYWPNLGHGNWGARVTMPIQPALPAGYDPGRVLLGDVDGDGYADLVYVEADRVRVWFNRSGNSWSAPIEVRGVPPVADGDAIYVADLYGTGVAGILWSAGPGNPARQRMSFLDLAGGVKPYLLAAMSNNLGATTLVQYASSTRFFLADDECSATRWRTPLPGPVQVVSSVEVIDHLSGSKHTSEFTYHGGYWDGPEKEFRGFAEVHQRSSQQFTDYNRAGLHAQAAFSTVPVENFSPPTLLKTFFHQGPVGDEYGAWEELDVSARYWPGDPPRLASKPAVDQVLRGYCTARNPHARRDMRDALRSLRGNVLRTELYALDGSTAQDRPYTVAEHVYGVREESAPQNAADRRRIFFPFAVASRTTQWERGSDPVTVFSFSGDYDTFGNAGRLVSIACPRGWRDMLDRPATDYLATLTQTDYAAPAANGPYIHDRVARVRTYEITGSSGTRVEELSAIAAGAAALRLRAEVLNFYDGDAAAADHGAFTGLDYGVVGRFGALTRTETLVMTDADLTAAYGAQVPPYFGQAAIAPDADYPAAFVALLPARAGYVYRPGGAAAPYTAGYFSLSMRREYDFHNAAGTGTGLVTGERDPLGNQTTIQYDTHGVFPVTVTSPRDANAQPLVVSATYDYRAMQPDTVTDANGNVTAVTFTADGMVSSIALRGKAGGNEGDQTNPGVRYEYHLRAFFESVAVDPTRPVPSYVRSLRRTHHDTDPDDTGYSIEAREYSDGFGRILQTRVLDDVVRFGDPQFGGGADVLDADVAASATAVVTGVAADPASPNVRVGGTQRYDNKGQVFERWEPYLDTGWDYTPGSAATRGQKVALYYDARGQLVRTVNPDGSEQHVIFGVPVNVDDPPSSPFDHTRFSPTPWEIWTYDANDNAGRTHGAAAATYQHHWNTPASIEVDALGRNVRAVVRHRTAGAPLVEHVTRSTYDILGRLTSTRDALGRLSFEYVHDLGGRVLRSVSPDAGTRLTALDAAGGLIESRDARGVLVLHAYDALRRPVGIWARDAAGEAMTLRQRLLYGDSPGAPQSAAANRLGRLYRHYDEAGLAEMSTYDFKGNVLASSRLPLSDGFMLSAIDDPQRADWTLPAPRVDWDAAMPPELDAVTYAGHSAFDALNRVKWSEMPACANGDRYRLRPSYNAAAGLEGLSLVGPMDANGNGPERVYVERMVYDARGQCVLIAYGNGVMTRYAHDPRTSRMVRLRSDRYTKQGALGYVPQPGALQDISYEYDLAGNLVSTLDLARGCGVRGNAPAQVPNALRQRMSDGDALLRRFQYDSLYRLVSASGREAALIPVPRPWTELLAANNDVASGVYVSANPPVTTQDNAPDLASLYEERYEYDSAGNMMKLTHLRGGVPAWLRHFGMAGFTPREWRQNVADVQGGVTPNWGSGGNRPTHCGNQDTQATTHSFDAAGNVITENGNRRFEWDHACRLKAFRIQAGAAEPSRYAVYLYDASGMRLKKLVRDGSGRYRVTTYVGGAFEHHRRITPVETKDNNSLHVMDSGLRVAVVRIGAAFDVGEGGPAVQYHHGDHLGGSVLVLGEDAAWVNREEYFPFGETSFGSFGRKRYRFTGKERDEESGLGYHGARYYSHASMRWISADPLGPRDGLNVYAYVDGNPLAYTDSTGLAKDQESSGGSPPPTICYEPEVSYEPGSNVPILHIHPLGSNVIHMAKPPGDAPAEPPAGGGGADKAESEPQQTSPILPEVGQSGSVVTAIGLSLARVPDYVSKTAVIWAGNISDSKKVWQGARTTALNGAEWLKATRGFEHLESTFLGKASYAVSNAAIRLWGNAARPILYQTVWKAVSAVYGFRAGVTGCALMRLIQTSMKKTPTLGMGTLFRLEARAYQIGRSVRTFGRGLGRRLPIIGAVLSGIGLAEDIQTGNVASGVGNALGVASGGAAAVGATAAAEVLAAGAVGYAIGSVINEYVAEPLIDKASPGSGALGDWYYRTFLK